MISITDNFFDDLESIKKKIDDVLYTESDGSIGWQGMRSDELSESQPDLYEILVSTIEKRFSIDRSDYRKIEFGFHYRKDNVVNIHQDDSDHNCLIFLKGDFNIWNGTGFYEKTPEAEILSLSVGFKENRAIFFDPKIPHSSLTGLNPEMSSARWTLNTFMYKKG